VFSKTICNINFLSDTYSNEKHYQNELKVVDVEIEGLNLQPFALKVTFLVVRCQSMLTFQDGMQPSLVTLNIRRLQNRQVTLDKVPKDSDNFYLICLSLRL
jgi:hypothetical protein